MPLIFFILLVLLIAQVGFWHTLGAILGAVLMMMLLVLLLIAVVIWVLSASLGAWAADRVTSATARRRANSCVIQFVQRRRRPMKLEVKKIGNSTGLISAQGTLDSA